MGFPKIAFRVVEDKQCPLYEYGDAFYLTGIAVGMNSTTENCYFSTAVIDSPRDKERCKILNGDLARIIIQYERADKVPVCLISCSGCTGSLRLEHAFESTLVDDGNQLLPNELGSMIHLFSDFSFFKNIDRSNFERVINFFKLRTFDKDDIIIRKGEPCSNFFIIVNGVVNVLNDAGITISTLGKGDVFGEMSLICNEPISATIQVREDTSILYLDKANFRKILDCYPSIQLYFSRLIAGRLSKANRIRNEDLTSGMIGNLSEIPPEALFQTLNMNRKTGILTIDELIKGTARFSFRQGGLIKARYASITGENAFYEILKENKGRFRFSPGLPPEDLQLPEIGYFMKLLMEGMQRLDENRGKKAHCAA